VIGLGNHNGRVIYLAFYGARTVIKKRSNVDIKEDSSLIAAILINACCMTQQEKNPHSLIN
jgi:hypothetical protein